MMKRSPKILFCIFALVLLFLMPGKSNAQEARAEALQQKQFDLREIDKAEARLESLKRPTSLETGTGKDVFLLQRHKFFFLTFDQSLTNTNNAFSQPERKADQYFTSNFSGGVDTVIDGKYNVSLRGNVGTTRYADFAVLDYDIYGGSLGISRVIDVIRPVGPILVGTDLSYSKYLGRGLGDELLSILSANVFVAHNKQLSKKSGVSTQFQVTYNKGVPQDFDSWRFSATPGLYYNILSEVSLFTGGSVAHVIYRDYFPSNFDTERRDTALSAFANLSYRPRNPRFSWLSAVFSIRYQSNDSSIASFDYKTVSENLGLSIRGRF